jgi:hypothetical protein
MFDLRVVLPASPTEIRGWLPGFARRILPLDPDPAAFGQPQMSPRAFMTDTTLRPLAVLPEIEAAGGFGVGLEVALPCGDDEVQPVGPVVVFVVVPMGAAQSEVQVFFPLGLAHESRPQVPAELRKSWPGVEILTDYMPRWVVKDLDRRALFHAIATRGPMPPGAPRRVPRTPLPWRDPLFAVGDDWTHKITGVEQAEIDPGEEPKRGPVPLPEPESGGAGRQPRVPGRPKDRLRWEETWRVAQTMFRQAKPATEIEEWLKKHHPHLVKSPDVIADIGRAGLAGSLGNFREPRAGGEKSR